MFHQAFADAATAAGDEDTAPVEAGEICRLVDCAMHENTCLQRRNVIFMPCGRPCQVTGAHGISAPGQLHIDFKRQQNTFNAAQQDDRP